MPSLAGQAYSSAPQSSGKLGRALQFSPAIQWQARQAYSSARRFCAKLGNLGLLQTTAPQGSRWSCFAVRLGPACPNLPSKGAAVVFLITGSEQAGGKTRNAGMHVFPVEQGSVCIPWLMPVSARLCVLQAQRSSGQGLRRDTGRVPL